MDAIQIIFAFLTLIGALILVFGNRKWVRIAAIILIAFAILLFSYSCGVNLGPINSLFSNLINNISNAEYKPPECDFIDEIQQKTEIIKWIDTPLGSGEWSGVKVKTTTTISLPEGWIAHIGDNDDQLGPLTISKGTLASIYAPYKCRPLERLEE